MWQALLQKLQQGDVRVLARCISLIENTQPCYEKLLETLPTATDIRIIGITRQPGLFDIFKKNPSMNIYQLVKNYRHV